jgi:hypothetical protein
MCVLNVQVIRERTEILSHHDKVYITRLPAVVEVDQHKAQIHDAYCGKALLMQGLPALDERFQRLHTTLSAAVLTVRTTGSEPFGITPLTIITF